MRFLTVLALLLIPALAVAGPNAGGVLLVHASTSLVYTTDTTSYCGQSGLSACSLAVTSVPWDPETTTVFYIHAEFPDTAQPRLKAITWGVDWDDSKLVILAHGSCADFDVPDGGWPASGTGIGQEFTETQTGLLTELYWFAAYAYGAEEDTTSFGLIPHPLQGGTMADDGMPPEEDSIPAFGRLGFGVQGEVSCPAALLWDEIGEAEEESAGGSAVPEDEGGLGELPNAESETFVELVVDPNQRFSDVVHSLRTEYALRVLVTMAPDGIWCVADEVQRETLASDSRVRTVTVGPIGGRSSSGEDRPEPGTPGYAAGLWNLQFEPSPPDTASGSGLGEFFEVNHGLPDSMRTWGADEHTSTYMMGDVGVSIFFMESDESSPNTETWTADEIDRAQRKCRSAFNVFSAVDVNTNLTFNIEDQRTIEVPVEPILESGTNLWMGIAMDSMGVDASQDAAERVTWFNNLRRQDEGYDWWISLFMVRNLAGNGQWPGGGWSYALYWGPCAYILLRNGNAFPPDSLDHIVVHETCHLFGVRDEDNDDCDCDRRSGYLHELNLNHCDCSDSVACVMRDAHFLTFCEWTRGQLGWRDSDDDGVLDPIDNPLATKSLLVGDAESLALGDWVDFRAPTAQEFLARLPASRSSMDRGRMLWDGIRYDGYACSLNVVKWRRNGLGIWHTADLDLDEESPVIDSVVVAECGAITGPDTLKLWFADSDTRGGRVRADATFWDGTSRRVIPDEFFAERGGGDVPVTQPIALGGHDVGPWNVVTLVWDVGGGHFDCGSDSFWHGGVADIREPGSGDLAFSIAGGRPNPSSEYVRWDVTQAAREPVHLGVVSVDGRLVRQWQKAELQPGRNRIVWDGRNDRGGKVAAGRYYLIATDSRGRQRSSPIIILR